MLAEPILKPITYLYTYTYHEDEMELCRLEQRSLFGKDTNTNILENTLEIDPSRSPFIKERVDVLSNSPTIDELINHVKKMPLLQLRFKVMVINHKDADKISYQERRAIERKIGLSIPGKPDLQNPEQIFAVLMVRGEWVFGTYHENKGTWFVHKQKPYQYSTALSTRVARSVVNIAVPNTSGIKAIDPCCGIGTVLVEALSMGIDIIGSDNNPLVMKGARANIAHFGFNGQVILRDIRDVTGNFDVAIIDLPYNLCSVITAEEQLEMLQSARRFAKRMIIVTVEHVDSIILKAGFTIVDRCVVAKGSFTREIIVCG